jgi:hypothetical protein
LQEITIPIYNTNGYDKSLNMKQQNNCYNHSRKSRAGKIDNVIGDKLVTPVL